MSPPVHNQPAEDELDEILNSIIDGQDSLDVGNVQPQNESQNHQNPSTANANLGIDEEVTIVKKRQPIPKLDEDRCASAVASPATR